MPLTLTNKVLPAQYALELAVNPLKPNFSGRLEIQLEPNPKINPDPQSPFSLTLHAARLILTKCFLKCADSDIPLKVSYDRPNQTVTLALEGPLPCDCKLVEINYMGLVHSIQTFRDSTYGLFKTNYLDEISGKSSNIVYATHFQPFGARQVFPVVDEQASKVPIKLSVETLARFKVASVGNLLSTRSVDYTENAVFDFEVTPAMAPSVFGFIIGDFEHIDAQVNSIPVGVYTTLGTSLRARYTLALIEKFLPVVEELFGTPYPLSKLDFAALPFLADGAMENWGLITIIQDQLLVGEPTDFAARLGLQQLVAHELVHQWLGNYVTFADWDLLWLNEALATWIGNYVIHHSGINAAEPNYRFDLEDDYEPLLDRDCFVTDSERLSISSIYEYMSSLKISNTSTTASIFTTDSYEKGIALVRMVAKSVGPTVFFAGLRRVIADNALKTVKSFDIWNTINADTPIDLQSLTHSWVRYQGFPLVRVSSTDSGLRVEQHVYLHNLLPEDLSLEDAPYHVPLNVKCMKANDLSVLPLVMTDRSMDLEISADQFVCINSGRAGYYRVLYSREVVENCLVPSIKNNKLTPLELIMVLNDYGKVVGTTRSTSDDLFLLLAIMDALSSPEWKIDFTVLKVMLDRLGTLNNIMLHFTDYLKFLDYVLRLTNSLFNKVGDWELNVDHSYDAAEMHARNSLLQFGLDEPEQQKVARTLFKRFFAHQGFLPKELASATFNATIRNAVQKDYKKILELVKNSDVSMLLHSNITSLELQTVALSSLGFVLDSALLHKSLNFVKTNIDSKMIELGLLGFLFSNDKSRKMQLWGWYKVNYDLWTKTSLRNGQWSEQLRNTMHNVSSMILGDIMQGDPELCDLRKKFVADKLRTLQDHGLRELVEELEARNEEKLKIAEFWESK